MENYIDSISELIKNTDSFKEFCAEYTQYLNDEGEVTNVKRW